MTFFFIYPIHWRYLYIITVLIHCHYTYITYKYFIESPRWLHSVGDKNGCLNSLNEIAIYNQREELWNKFKNNNLDLINKLGTI